MILARGYLSKMLRKKLKLDSTPVQNVETTLTTTIADDFLKLEIDLDNALKELCFKTPVAYVYHPLDYASKPHSVFTHKYLKSPKEVLFVGMNPGPWGMCQTGIPFGEVKIVKEWFEINEEVLKPDKECPERQVLGFECHRSEISGQRIWGLMKNICGTPENFFKSCYMYNYCPIAMLKNNGGNVTPTEVKGEAQRRIEELCDETLKKVIQLLQVKIVIGVGKYSEKRARTVLESDNPFDTKVLYLLHPSPRVANNQKWVEKAEQILVDLKLMPFLKP